MPKNRNLFGTFFGKACRDYNRKQIVRPLPPKARGAQLSAGSQMNLWHSDDYNFWSKTWGNMVKTRHLVVPFQYKKDIESNNLNCTLPNTRLTPSSLYAMDDMGGFDEYIMRTQPEEMRSCYGEKLRNLMYYYQDNPEVKSWGLPARALIRGKEQRDPMFARYKFLTNVEDKKRRTYHQHKTYSPYYLPVGDALMHPARQDFGVGSQEAGKLNLWWKEGESEQGSPELEKRLRWRLAEAKMYEQRHADSRIPGGYRKGCGMGHGGPSNTHVAFRSKTYKHRDGRAY